MPGRPGAASAGRVRARSRLTVDADGRVARMTEDPPVAWRRTPDGLYLVGTAGGLTGDDDVALDIDVATDAELVVRSNAATVVYAGSGTSYRVGLCAGAGASVDWRPEPVIVTAGAVHLQAASLFVAPTTRLDWTEIVVLGRHGEEPGRAELRLECVVTGDGGLTGGCGPAGDRALLRHHLTVGAGAPGWAGPAVLGANRTVGMRLRAGPDLSPPPGRRGEGWAWLALDGPGWVLLAVAPDLPTLAERMAAAG